MSIVSGSWALKKWGIDAVLGGDKGQHDQLTPFLRQQFDMLTEARDYALQYPRQNYTKSVVDDAMDRLSRLINQNGQYSTIAEMANALSIYASILSILESTTRLRGNFYAPRANDPFPLWTTIYITSRRNAAVKLPFTGGYAGKSSILAYRLPNDINAEPIPAPEFIDANTIRTPNMPGSFMIYRSTNVPLSVGNEIRDTTVLNDLLRRFHLRTMELGQAFSLVDEYRIREFSGEVITKIEYRDRVIERPVEVVKEVVREVPGPERVVEKIIQVPGETKYVPTPQQAQNAVTHEITFGELPKAKSDRVLDNESMVLVIHHRPERWNDNITYHMARKDLSGNYSTTSLEKWSTGTDPAGLKSSRVVYASLDNPPTASTKLRQMIAQSMGGVELGREYTVDQQRLAPIGWTWKYVVNAEASNPALDNNANPAPNPAPGPQPQPPQPQPQPRPGNGFMSTYEKQQVIAMATGLNRTQAKGWTGGNVGGVGTKANGSEGQHKWGSVVQGAQMTWDPAGPWWYSTGDGGSVKDPAGFARIRHRKFDTFQTWFVFMEQMSNRENNARAQVRNTKMLVLRKNSDTWEIVQQGPGYRTNDGEGWNNRFLWNMSTPAGGISWDNTNEYTETAVPTNLSGVAHGGPSPWKITNPDSIEALMVIAEARVAPSTPNAKIAVHIGGDLKWNGDSSIMRWYPGFGVSSLQPLDSQWRRIYHLSVMGANDADPRRAISQQRFLNSKVPVPDMNAQPGGGGHVEPSPSPNPAPNPGPAPQPPAGDDGTFGYLRGRHNFVYIKQTPNQNGENRWLVEFLGIEDGKPMDNSVTERDQALLNARQWSGTRTFPAFVWTGGKELPSDLSGYVRTTITVDRNALNSVDPWHEIGIWKDNATVGDWSEATKKR